MHRVTKTFMGILTVSATLLCGCVSQSDYNELVSRVEYLESLHNVEKETSASTETFAPASEETVMTEDNKEDENIYLYYIDSMSAEEVATECEYYFNNLPYKGESYEEYEGTMKVTPIISTYWNYSDGIYYKFYTAEIGQKIEPPMKDIIKSINIYGIYPQMDGSIGFGDNTYNPVATVRVELWISDYDKAAEIYDLLFDYSLPNYQPNEREFGRSDSAVRDYRETTSWRAEGMFRTSDSSWSGETFLTMEKQGEFYVLIAQYSTVLLKDALKVQPKDKDAIGTATILTASLNVRSSPEQTSSRIGALTTGQVVDLIAIVEGGEWAKIKFNDQIGYVKTEFLEIKY